MSPGGILTIGTTAEESQILLFIKDQGSGLDPKLINKLGTPFLTTKEKGTGLGLAVCYSIANHHNARIELDTGPEGNCVDGKWCDILIRLKKSNLLKRHDGFNKTVVKQNRTRA